ncbi:MAG TPA: HNH endonuclease [Urbifossiella sp.]|nr:HNH endonuclease [Urbifossiella sp.]
MDDSTEVLHRLAKLKVDRARGDPAPHKPLLLLAVLDLLDAGRLTLPTIPLSAELTYQFLTYWRIVAHRRKAAPDIRMPFHHLSGDRIWEPLDANLQPSLDRKLTRFARLPDMIACLFGNKGFCQMARRVLVASYFLPSELIALAATLGIPESELVTTGAAIATTEREAAIQRGRDVKFRLVVVAAYRYTCALSRHRLTTITRGSMVDAAHIHQFADSRNNDPRNGLALSKNSHWMFDQGLWSIAENLTVLVASSQFTEEYAGGTPLTSYAGQRLMLPDDEQLWPDPTYLAWHRGKKYLGA